MTNITDMQDRQEEDDLALWQEQRRRHDPHYDGHGLAAHEREVMKQLPSLQHEEYLAMQAEYDRETS